MSKSLNLSLKLCGRCLANYCVCISERQTVQLTAYLSIIFTLGSLGVCKLRNGGGFHEAS